MEISNLQNNGETFLFFRPNRCNKSLRLLLSGWALKIIPLIFQRKTILKLELSNFKAFSNENIWM